MAKADCTQESEVFTLNYIFHELVILSDAMRVLTQTIPERDPISSSINCALKIFQRRFDELVFELDKMVFRAS